MWADVTGLRQAIFSLVDGDMHLGRFGVFGERTLDELEVPVDGGSRSGSRPRSRGQCDADAPGHAACC